MKTKEVKEPITGELNQSIATPKGKDQLENDVFFDNAPALIGGFGGVYHQDIRCSKNKKAHISKLKVWASSYAIREIDITFSDGEKVTRGNHDDQCKSFVSKSFDNDLVTALFIWPNKTGDRCGAFKVETEKNSEEFFPKMSDPLPDKYYSIDTGTGVIMGMISRSGEDIDSLGFVFDCIARVPLSDHWHN